jgi:hypothetical protein
MTQKPLIVLDVECLPNYFLIAFKKLGQDESIKFNIYGEGVSFERGIIDQISNLLHTHTSFGFNSVNYDMPMIYYALIGATTTQLHALSTHIIENAVPHWMTYKTLNMDSWNLPFDHFDLKEPAPAVMISLKNYATRLGSPRLQEFFVDPHAPLEFSDVEAMQRYCVNDLDVTIDLYNAIEGEIEIRKHMGAQYQTDLRSKSGAQVAEAILLKETGYNGPKPIVPHEIKYTAPDCVFFISEHLRELKGKLENETFLVNQSNGQPREPGWMKKFKVTIGSTNYKVGLGGLHDQRKKSVYKTTSSHTVLDVDVSSYYPSMIIHFGFAPKHMGSSFYEAYKRIYDTRLKAKREKDKLTDKSLKLVLNSTFGKFGSMYSKLYAPDLMLQVTLTGQLMLLMLIERLELIGVEVFYANTDGITVHCPSELRATCDYVIQEWEFQTGMNMESTEFRRTAIRDVNNFVNITSDGEIKAKGIYAEAWAYSDNRSPIMLQKGIQTPIVFEAVRKYLLDFTPIQNTIRECRTVGKFLSARTVNGGGTWNEVPIGKMVRWYYSTNGHPIRYLSNGNLVPKTNEAHGVAPMMDLANALPADLNIQWYIDEAEKMLEDLGVTPKGDVGELPEWAS